MAGHSKAHLLPLKRGLRVRFPFMGWLSWLVLIQPSYIDCLSIRNLDIVVGQCRRGDTRVVWSTPVQGVDIFEPGI